MRKTTPLERLGQEAKYNEANYQQQVLRATITSTQGGRGRGGHQSTSTWNSNRGRRGFYGRGGTKNYFGRRGCGAPTFHNNSYTNNSHSILSHLSINSVRHIQHQQTIQHKERPTSNITNITIFSTTSSIITSSSTINTIDPYYNFNNQLHHSLRWHSTGQSPTTFPPLLENNNQSSLPLFVIQNGYKIQFTKKPIPWRNQKKTTTVEDQHHINEAETIKRRPILDCQKLNSFIQVEHFKMEGVPVLRELMEKDDYICKIDLKDTYVVVPIHVDSQDFLSFENEGTVYQYKSLAFGLSVAPRVSFKIMRYAIEPLRKEGIRIIYYLDDIYILAKTKQEMDQATNKQSNDDISTIFEDYQSNEEDSTVAYFSKENVQMDSRAWKEVESAVIDSQDEKSELVKEQVDFVEEYFRFCLLFKKGNLYKCLNISESNFSRLLVWPAVEVSIESMELLEFLPGEYLLKSSQEKYNADGCIVDEENNEMFLLEVSGKLLLNEKWKYGYDHVKCTFGALSIFNAAFKKYFFATEETAMKLQTPYLHAMEGSLHLWVLELCSNKLYISNKVFKCQIPKSMDDTKNIIAMGNLLWCLKMKLERVHNILKAMKEEHNNYEVQRMLGGSSRSRLSLVEMVSTEIQKPVKGEGYGILLPEEKDESDL
ncbi:hypothetical protein G6F57_008522 [Rhizopus arrhizus]|nr:hypothetical protein G6F27_009341 [Rhizopus arrhizus]KAG1097231.1 hypothetical protein G6F39_006189 [Rhizopus arrhizus]KAG1291263.1 hypothetical protein G6F66_007961 [Rhizopus arrhizus]KAG1340052.1 hypothetical protein G6F63_008321 [Rhizopus arrhizus]KAG1476812.1 hypothetical protein G6F57_008522 [Rhizopus arrhizus]